MTNETVPFDAADVLKDPDGQRELLIDAFASGDAIYINTALSAVARARGMASVARGSGASPGTFPAGTRPDAPAAKMALVK